MTEVDPVWQHNISKKIVQLTNVVFRLHADSIDNRNEVQRLREQYEEELAQIEAASKANLELAQKEADDYHPAIESTVRSEFETKYNQTKIQFEKARIYISMNKWSLAYETISKSSPESTQEPVSQTSNNEENKKGKQKTIWYLYRDRQEDQ